MNEGLPYFSKITSMIDEPLGENQLANGCHISNSSVLQPWKDNYHSNFFSRNPMLSKYSFFHSTDKPGRKCSSGYAQSLPCFDFSAVEIPFKLSVERLAHSSRQEFESQLPSPDPTTKSQDKNEQEYGGDGFLTNKGRTSWPCSPLDLKAQGQEGHISTKLIGGRNWESLLNNYSFTKKESVLEHKEGLLPLFEIPLDIVIDKCLLQEILLQYPFIILHFP